MKTLEEQFYDYAVVPVVVLDDAEDAAPLAEALVKGGIPCAEVTFRTEAAEESIRIMSEKYPEMLVGAGTVLTTEQVDRAVAAGAKFIVSPGFDPEIVDYCMEKKYSCFSRMRFSFRGGAGSKTWAEGGKILPGRAGRRTCYAESYGSALYHAEVHAYRRDKYKESEGVSWFFQNSLLWRKLDGKRRYD